MRNKIFINLLASAALAVLTVATARAERRFYMPMDLQQGQVTESLSGRSFDVATANVAESVEGVDGQALRLDGYSNYVAAQIDCGDLSRMTFSVWCAMETYPIIEHDIQNETESTCIAGNYDAAAKQGFGFFITRLGKVTFKYYSGGWPVEVKVCDRLPLYKWNNLVAVADGSKLTVYLDGVAGESSNCRTLAATGTFMIGKSAEGRTLGSFLLNAVNGIVDEIEIYDEALSQATIQGWATDAVPDLAAVAEGRYDDDLWRPVFHGMPSRNWTNETHGLVYYNGKYHLFFQKNANGPYMSRLQWGHLVSENLCEWQEMPIALGSDCWFDLKGCWSGCVAVDDVVTGGKPGIIYTGVDYARAMIAQASPADDDLLVWTKQPSPIINGRPAGLSDDFRDPYFFRNGSDAYIIVGSSKDGKGVCTLHKFNPTTRTWSNDGTTFFQAANAMYYGSFWEMPNLTAIDGTHLFTTTPLGITGGVRALYWTGSLNSDGTYNSSATPATIEFKGFAKEGYGLLSPTVMQHDGKTIALGIVPDKLPSEQNYAMGWAHTYSLPREWSVSADGKLLQKPYSGLEAMRGDMICPEVSASLTGSEVLGDVPGRALEVMGEFTVADSDFGFTFFKNGSTGARLYYSPSTARLVLDMRTLERVSNDSGVFNGLYETALPSAVAKGSVMKLHVFVDHSIMDIFVNDMWASSVRLFPTNTDAVGLDVFSTGGPTLASVKAWTLSGSSSGVGSVTTDCADATDIVDVYNFSGTCIRRGVQRADATQGLPAGFYIVGGRKFLVK